jgi:thiamine-phosphate pyrophosphorylase
MARPEVQALIVTPAGAPGADLTRLIDLAGRHDAACLIAGDPDLAAALGADGVQIAWEPAAYAGARRTLGAGRQIGCLAGLSRHDAMEAAEAGADYVGLGPGPGPGPGRTGDFAALLDLTAWWAELIVVPCVVFGAPGLGQVAGLAAAGADFVALGPDLWSGLTADRLAASLAEGTGGR